MKSLFAILASLMVPLCVLLFVNSTPTLAGISLAAIPVLLILYYLADIRDVLAGNANSKPKRPEAETPPTEP